MKTDKRIWAAPLMAIVVLLSLMVVGGAAAATAGDERTLVVVDDDIAPGLNWDGASVASHSAQFAMDQLYGRLHEYKVTYAPNGSAKSQVPTLAGQLAGSWTREGLTWTVKLRQGVISCAGNELTADDVVYTFARAKSVSGDSPISWYVLNVESVMSDAPLKENATAADKRLKGEITKVDRYTVKIRQFAPNRLMFYPTELMAGGIFDSKELKKHATSADPWANKWQENTGAAGYGPYCLDSWVKGSTMTFQKNPGWKIRPVPHYDKVIVRKVPSGANRVAAVGSGSADVAAHLTSRQLLEARKSNGVAVTSFNGGATLYFDMNWRRPPFENVKLRQAIAYAIPYSQIIQNGFNGFAVKARGFVPSTFGGFHPNNPYFYNPVKAKQLLAEAGYPGGRGLEKFRESFQISYSIELQEQLQPVGTIIAAALNELNIPATLNPLPDAELARRLQVTRDLPMALNTIVLPWVPDAGYAIQVMYIPAEKGGSTPSTNYDNKQVQDLWLGQARDEPNAQKRVALIRQALNIAAREVGMLPVVEMETAFAHRTDVTGFVWATDSGALRLMYLRPTGPKYDVLGNVVG